MPGLSCVCLRVQSWHCCMWLEKEEEEDVVRIVAVEDEDRYRIVMRH
jgi:hypothetical protein